MEIKTAYTRKELAEILQLEALTSVSRLAKKEGWQSQPRKGRGGGKEWLFASMPQSTQLAIRTAEEQAALETGGNLPSKAPGHAPALTTSTPDVFDGKRRSKAVAKAYLLKLYLDWQNIRGHTVAQKEAFVEQYVSGAWPELLTTLGKGVSWKSIERWKLQQAKADSVLALVDTRGLSHRGKSSLTEQHRVFILGSILNPNAPCISSCVRAVQQKCADAGIYQPSGPTIRRFIKAYESQCFDEWTLFRRGQKAWNDMCAISIMRDWSRVGVGDLVVADGHTLNFETIDPETGKPRRMTLLLFFDCASNYPLGWEVMPTENTACISSAFRRACITLGKYPKVIYLDNGKAFRGKYFKGTAGFDQAEFLGLYTSLGCSVIHAWPYHGQSKIIERFFATFHDMEVMMPSYTGNSIANKPPRLHRGETLHRQLYEKMGARPLTMEETHTVIALWFGEYVHRPQYRSHLKGKTPVEVFEPGVGPGVDVEKLNLLMLEKEIRTISKDGIRLFGKLFWHEALASRRHPVIVRYDNVLSPHTVLVYNRDGEFICEARDREHFRIACGVHPAAGVLGTPEDQAELAEAIALKKQQERLAGANFRVMLEEVVLPEARKQTEAKLQTAKILPMPQAAKPALSLEEEAAIEAAKARARAEIDTKNSANFYIPSWQKRFNDEMERYEYLFFVRHEGGKELDERDAAWVEKYEATEVFRRYQKPRYDQLLELFEFRRKVSSIEG